MRWRVLIGVLALAGCLPASGAAQSYAPLDQPGPPLTVPVAQLRASLVCEPSVRNAKVEPVLLNPATGVTAAQNYSWNWEPALDKLGIPWCAYTAPHSTLDNIETSGEYIVYAIRTMYAQAHRKIAILGHSQGGMSMRWALRFWPDTRGMVDDVVGFAGSNHGTTVGGPSICGDGCAPADWQQFAGSNFIKALNSDAETFPGISYTEVYTHRDEVVQPNSSPSACSSCLHTGGGAITNVATQDLCPTDTYEHVELGTIDPVAYALAVDALTHPGPADPARIPASVCAQQYQPGVNPANVQANLTALQGAPGLLSVAVSPAAPATTGVALTKSEPPLACYVFASCQGTDAPALLLSVRRHHRQVRVLVRVREGSALLPVQGVVVTVGRHHRTTGRHGRTSFRLRRRKGKVYRLSATRAGFAPATARIR
jgi:hypothetical protein